MTFPTHPGSTDLLIPTPARDEHWDAHRIHTHYFGFSVPDAQIGAFLYIRYQPEFRQTHGGVCIFQGLDNVSLTDIEYLDYQIAMPWPEVVGTTITTANGLDIEFLEPGKIARLTYSNAAEGVSLDVLQTAVTPLVARGHIMPGEEDHHDRIAHSAGGSEQFMHAVGELTVRGTTYPVDCFAPRDRSWNQVRTETYVPSPPLGWTPMYFGEDLVFNQISFEPLDSDPAWAGLYDVGDRPTHHFGWIQRGEQIRSLKWVRRDVLEYHPRNYIPLRQEITAEDEVGDTYRLLGESIATAPLPAWPNSLFHDSVVRWTDETGRVTHATFQGIWMADYQRSMKARASRATAGGSGGDHYA
ncbi:tyrosine protein kinase [Mycobacterium sp.]|uniref:DUF7064 domain-containing protein n=1 Tax=Mycobacterium sp. TaxID=1785 RepID=UPI001225AFA3|nr:tyrosine protein kinase [Mycobacterium sp.]TAM65764.1 MAG: tyrosine protein kinase [Mycobacterium sp.]